MIYKESFVDVELTSGTIYRSFFARAIGKDDNYADRFGVRVFRNGEPVILHGCSCQGVFMAPNGESIYITSLDYTSVDGNRAWVQLPQACYDYEGQFTLAIKVVGNGITGTMRIVDGVVSNTGVDGAVAPRDSIPTYQEILALYTQMQDIVGQARDQHGEGNANQVDGYHAAELLSSFNGVNRKAIIKYSDIELEDDVETTVTFDTPFPEEIVHISLTPRLGFNVLSALSIVSMSTTGCVLKQKNGQGTPMVVRYMAIGY